MALRAIVQPARPRAVRTSGFALKELVMGKYFVGWILGVPAIVLVVLWFFFR